MKSLNYYSCAALLGGILFLAACGKQEETTPSTSQSSASIEQSLEEANAEAEKQSGQIKASTEAAVSDAQGKADAVAADLKTQSTAAVDSTAATANNAVPTTTAQAQTFIERAQAYVAEKKYTEALNTLSQLANVKLTPEQQDLVTKLKAQISTAMAGGNEGLKAVGGLLEKK